MNKNLKGGSSEARVAHEFMELGIAVSRPMSDVPYDLLADLGDEILRVQVKTGWVKDGCIDFNTSAVYKGEKQYYEEGDIDGYAVYSKDTDKVYWVDYEDAPASHMRLRVEGEGCPYQTNWASDYLLEDVMRATVG